MKILFVVLSFWGFLHSCSHPQVRDIEFPRLPKSSSFQFDGSQSLGISPQVNAVSGRAEYDLVYKVTEDGQGISTRYMGPSGVGGVAARVEAFEQDGVHYLIYVVSNSLHVTLATWKIDPRGGLMDGFVRTDSILEYRPIPADDQELISDVEWRPMIDGVGVGEWRR